MKFNSMRWKDLVPQILDKVENAWDKHASLLSYIIKVFIRLSPRWPDTFLINDDEFGCTFFPLNQLHL